MGEYDCTCSLLAVCPVTSLVTTQVTLEGNDPRGPVVSQHARSPQRSMSPHGAVRNGYFGECMAEAQNQAGGRKQTLKHRNTETGGNYMQYIGLFGAFSCLSPIGAHVHAGACIPGCKRGFESLQSFFFFSGTVRYGTVTPTLSTEHRALPNTQ